MVLSGPCKESAVRIKLLPSRAHPITAYLAAAVWTCAVLLGSYLEANIRAEQFLENSLTHEADAMHRYLQNYFKRGNNLSDFKELEKYSQQLFQKIPALHTVALDGPDGDELTAAIAPGSLPAVVDSEKWQEGPRHNLWGEAQETVPPGVQLYRQDAHLQVIVPFRDKIDESGRLRFGADSYPVDLALQQIFGCAIALSSIVLIGYFAVTRTLGRVSSQLSFALTLTFTLAIGLLAYWLVLGSGYEDRGRQVASDAAQRLQRATTLGIGLDRFSDISDILATIERNSKEISALNLAVGESSTVRTASQVSVMGRNRDTGRSLSHLIPWFKTQTYAPIRAETAYLPGIGILATLDRRWVAWQFLIGALRIAVPALLIAAVGLLGLRIVYFFGRRRRASRQLWGHSA